MSCGRHWYFFCTWHLHLSFAARFSNMPYFGSHWAVTRLRNFIKSGTYIAKHFVFMLIIFQVGRQSTSIRFFCVCLKKISLLLNRSVFVAWHFFKSIAWVRAFKFVLRAYKGTQDIVPKSRRIQIFVFYIFMRFLINSGAHLWLFGDLNGFFLLIWYIGQLVHSLGRNWSASWPIM